MHRNNKNKTSPLTTMVFNFNFFSFLSNMITYTTAKTTSSPLKNETQAWYLK